MDGGNMRDWLRSLLPDYWVMSGRYSAAWDARLRALMSKHKFEWVNVYTAKLGPATIWVTNHPYGSFTQHIPTYSNDRPSRKTIAYAQRKLLADLSAASE